MSKVVFNYGVMNSAKTSLLLMTDFNYKSKGVRTILVKPDVDTRFGSNIIKSRVGVEATADIVVSNTSKNLVIEYPELLTLSDGDVILVDEAQFLSPNVVKYLASFATAKRVSILAYGLMQDFKNELFPGSKAWVEVADTLNEVKSTCMVPHCERKASRNIRLSNGKPVFDGEVVQIGAEESYTAVCSEHWYNYPTEV